MVSSPVERIGLFGGSFDPVHNTHCDIARAALSDAQLDRVFFVVAARPPHKAVGLCASIGERLAMVEAAVRDDPRMEASRVEIDREGPSYTVDTLRQFHRKFPAAELHLIIGMDSLLDLPRWREPEEIAALAKLLVVPRPGLDNAGPPELEGRYRVLPFDQTRLSSTEVRERIASGEAFGELVPPAVERLIKEKGIYDAANAQRSR
ncbi:MAG: nicotinate (nicotinamide) nucleotide adenylyltransferase [Nitrospiraceae bacterium]|nr:nicotinate (nicotinamide) nucleotide adenylyltransferase [Nitrospiraceae bacterium]